MKKNAKKMSGEEMLAHIKKHGSLKQGGTTLTLYDTADYLKTEEDMAMYLEACFAEAGDDPAFIAKALGTIARARGMGKLAKKTGKSRTSLYKALSGKGNPEFATIMQAITALGLRLSVKPL